MKPFSRIQMLTLWTPIEGTLNVAATLSIVAFDHRYAVSTKVLIRSDVEFGFSTYPG
jgi:hypothetical protein